MASYGVRPGHVLYGKSSLYDNALGVIAFGMCGRMDLAAGIIKSVRAMAERDGVLWADCDVHGPWPEREKHPGGIIRTGATAWFGYAVVFYLETLLERDAGARVSDPEFGDALRLATAIAGMLVKYRVNAPDDPRHGLFAGGEYSTVLQVEPGPDTAREVYLPETVEWISTEHNIDVFFFYKALYGITGDEQYRVTADTVRERLLRRLWNDAMGQFNRGMSVQGIDAVESLDCASWGALFLRSAGIEDKARRALEAAERYRVSKSSVEGYTPYRNSTIYESAAVNSRFFPADPRKRWNDMDLIWPEGSLGVAMARTRLGLRDGAISIIRSMTRLQGPDGGIPYATEEVPFQFSRESAAASAAWLVMCVSALEDNRAAARFWR